jgi:hypothetical protein
MLFPLDRENTMNFTKQNYANEEADRLSRVTGRDIKVETFDCPCDYWKYCPTCGGTATAFELVYVSCGHSVTEDDFDCKDTDCAERERLQMLATDTHGLEDAMWRAA